MEGAKEVIESAMFNMKKRSNNIYIKIGQAPMLYWFVDNVSLIIN